MSWISTKEKRPEINDMVLAIGHTHEGIALARYYSNNKWRVHPFTERNRSKSMNNQQSRIEINRREFLQLSGLATTGVELAKEYQEHFENIDFDTTLNYPLLDFGLISDFEALPFLPHVDNPEAIESLEFRFLTSKFLDGLLAGPQYYSLIWLMNFDDAIIKFCFFKTKITLIEIDYIGLADIAIRIFPDKTKPFNQQFGYMIMENDTKSLLI